MKTRIKKATTELEGALAERKLRMVALKEEMAEAKKQLKATREEARQRVVAFIEKNPGASYEMAAERCGASGPQVFLPNETLSGTCITSGSSPT
jgi:hypothetical protein